MGTLWRHLKKPEKNLTKPKKGDKSQSAKKSKEGPFCFRMVLYFMLEALDAFKIKYCVLMAANRLSNFKIFSERKRSFKINFEKF